MGSVENIYNISSFVVYLSHSSAKEIAKNVFFNLPTSFTTLKTVRTRTTRFYKRIWQKKVKCHKCQDKMTIFKTLHTMAQDVVWCICFTVEMELLSLLSLWTIFEQSKGRQCFISCKGRWLLLLKQSQRGHAASKGVWGKTWPRC